MNLTRLQTLGPAPDIRLGVLMLAGISLMGNGCGNGTGIDADAGAPTGSLDGGSQPAVPSDAGDVTCGAPAAALDFCQALPIGSVVACSTDANGNPSSDGYLEIALPGGAHLYTCATSWIDNGSGGYWFDAPDAFMSDPQSCCGGAPTPVPRPMARLVSLGALHGPREIKPQESADPGAGALRQNPFAVIVRDQEGAAAFASALANWQAWSTDGNPHPGPDGTGEYYFVGLGVNYVILEAPEGEPVLVIGPEVSITSDGLWPLGHPTLGPCGTGGGAPLVLMAGEIWGTTINNHSGRFNHDPAVTEEALAEAAKLFNCLGIAITGTTYDPPKL